MPAAHSCACLNTVLVGQDDDGLVVATALDQRIDPARQQSKNRTPAEQKIRKIGQALHEEVVQRKFDPLTGPDRKLVGQANRTCYCKKLPE